jgi:hypothetical protein
MEILTYGRVNDFLLFLLLYINQLPVVGRTQNLLCIIQRRSERLTLFVCYISINCLEWSVPKIYYISFNCPLEWSNNQVPVSEECTQNVLYIIQRRSEQLALFVCYIIQLLFRLLYINQLPVVEWSVPKMYYISSNADRSDSCKINDVSFNADRTQNLLYIIQRRSQRLDVFFRLLYQSTACSGSYPKFIMYHPTLIGATRAFCLECTQNLLSIIQRRSERLALFV